MGKCYSYAGSDYTTREESQAQKKMQGASCDSYGKATYEDFFILLTDSTNTKIRKIWFVPLFWSASYFIDKISQDLMRSD